MVCGISATGEDDHLIFTQKVSSGNYFFVCDNGDNNVVGLIQPDTDITDTPESYIPDDGGVGTMRYYMLEAMEIKNDNICDDSYSSCGG